jgi:SPP1 family predicted phage head-tail adaptor
MRERLILEQLTETPDTIGGQADSWSELDDVPGDVQPLEGRELYQAQAVVPMLSHRVTIRYRDDVAVDKHRFRWLPSKALLEIRALVNRDGRRRFLVADCVQRPSSSS